MSLKMSNKVFDGPKVTLVEMIEARDERVTIQKEFLNMDTHSTLLCATMNIPGAIKTSPILEETFKKIVLELYIAIDDIESLPHLYRNNVSGYEFFLLAPLSKEEFKEKMIFIEEHTALGRLVDLDVLYLEGQQVKGLSRESLGYEKRRCYLCSQDAKSCARSKNHTITDIQNRIAQIIEEKGCR